MNFKALKASVWISLKSLFLGLSIVVAVSHPALAKPSEALNQTTQKYRSSKMVQMDVKKVIDSELLGKQTTYDGKIYLADGKFRWENKTPDETLLVFDGATIWSVQIPPKAFGGPNQVGIGKVDKKTKSQILISTLLGRDPISKSFKVLKEEKTKDSVKVEIAPLKDDLVVKSITLLLNPKEKKLMELSYVDDVGNKTKMQFSNIKFLNKEDKKLFKYQPSKSDQVSNL